MDCSREWMVEVEKKMIMGTATPEEIMKYTLCSAMRTSKLLACSTKWHHRKCRICFCF